MFRLIHRQLFVSLAAGLLLSGCASYHRFRPTAVEHAGISARGRDTGDMTDAAVVSYADRTRDVLRKRFHIARNVRQTASTAQVFLAGAAGLAGAFQAGATTIATLGTGSAAVPQLGEVFGSGNRAIAYQQAVAKISEAEDAYFKLRAGMHPVVPDNALTIEGALLLEAINGATDTVELFQAGMMPTLDQMRRAEGLELRRRAALKESRGGGGSSGSGGSGGTGERRQANAGDTGTGKPATRPVIVEDPIKLASLEARRENLARLVDTLSTGAAAKILQPNAASALDDAIARPRLKDLIKAAEDPLLQHLETTVRTAAAASPPLPITAVPAPKTLVPVATPAPVASATPPPVTPAPTATLASRRSALAEKIAQFPEGSAAKIVQPRKPQNLDDATARKLLTDMANDAEDPLLSELEKKVRNQVLR